MMTDRPPSLLEQLRQQPGGDAWKRFVELYTGWLESWVWRLAHLPVGDPTAAALVRSVLVVVCREFPAFLQNGRPGSFRVWLRKVLVACLRDHLKKRRDATTGLETLLDQLEDPLSDLSRQWDQEHHGCVIGRLLEMGQRRFPPYAWEAFRRTVLVGQVPSQAAAELRVSPSAVLLAQSRILAWLRREADALID